LGPLASKEGKERTAQLESADDRIIDLLSRDADLTYREMAEKLGLNESTVRKRVLALRRTGVIRRVMVEVDTERMGLKLNAQVGVDADPSKLIGVGRELVAMPEAAMVFSTSGGHDFFVVVWTKDSGSLSRIIDSVAAIDGVTKVVPSIILERLR